ncbi:hypothetical protein ACG7TL_001857 [Trametes sanguinea]
MGRQEQNRCTYAPWARRSKSPPAAAVRTLRGRWEALWKVPGDPEQGQGNANSKGRLSLGSPPAELPRCPEVPYADAAPAKPHCGRACSALSLVQVLAAVVSLRDPGALPFAGCRRVFSCTPAKVAFALPRLWAWVDNVAEGTFAKLKHADMKDPQVP